MKKNIYVFGAGYVGLSNGVLLSQFHNVTMVDINEDRVNMLNSRISPIKDKDIQNFLTSGDLNIKAVDSINAKVKTADFAVIATPTNFDEKTGRFDTSSIESVLNQLKFYGFNGVIVIRSTVPLGYTAALRKNGWKRVIFIPEFLREGSALYDNLNPSRIVMGTSGLENENEDARTFAKLLLEGAEKKDTPVILMKSTEAESVKLFSNTYLALRVAFFNELDSYALSNGLSSKDIITAVGLDPRIGNFYQNPSFGYGGYCLPKDTKQLLASFAEVPQTLMSAIVKSNDLRKQFIVDKVLERNPKCVGVLRLVMKKNSDNFRESAIFDVITKLKERNVEVIIYEPLIKDENFQGNLVVNSFEEFLERADLILANRIEPELPVPPGKLFSRDIFEKN